jgi:hypothetical protein
MGTCTVVNREIALMINAALTRGHTSPTADFISIPSQGSEAWLDADVTQAK